MGAMTFCVDRDPKSIAPMGRSYEDSGVRITGSWLI